MPFERGNTLGRGRPPAGKSLSEALRVALTEQLPDGRTNYRAIADALVAKARNGDIMAIREVLDRTEGKVSARVELRNDVRPINFNILPIDLETL
jgi:hypothetical protein